MREDDSGTAARKPKIWLGGEYLERRIGVSVSPSTSGAKGQQSDAENNATTVM